MTYSKKRRRSTSLELRDRCRVRPLLQMLKPKLTIRCETFRSPIGDIPFNQSGQRTKSRLQRRACYLSRVDLGQSTRQQRHAETVYDHMMVACIPKKMIGPDFKQNEF